MQPTRVGTNLLFDVGQKRDDVVLHRALDLQDAVGVELHVLLANLRGDSFRDEARDFHRVARRKLNFEPHGELAVLGPEELEVFRRITGDHGRWRTN